jgi:serine/threonine protein kinase/Tfp pilus assembly protein PilF
MIGLTISHYKILEKLGEGGMGVVYKAEDTRLKRSVALKFLPSAVSDDAARKRFVQEAQAASSLDHPNICSIHEVDETPDGRLFIVMPCYEGETLQARIERGPMDIPEALSIMTQVVSGLSKAHERGIVHRDMKPANIFVTRGGLVKIVDFGIAKLSGRTEVTRTGETPGTAAYMSPEQLRGEDADRRSDIWAIGVILYELLAGRRPFAGAYDYAIVYAVMNEEPKQPSVFRRDLPADLERVVLKAMAKSPAERYQDAESLVAALEACAPSVADAAPPSGATQSQELPSIAVLPFKDMSPAKDQEYFCEGIAEELLNALVQIEGLRVAARTSASQFKDKAVNVRAIGRELDVRNVLEGSVRKAGNRLRITAQLINVEDGYHLFSEKYDRTADDIFAIQDEISLAIVDRLKVRLMGSDRSKLTKRHTENEEAYRLYLQGRYFWNRRHEVGVQQGLEYFQKAIAIDPEYALAYSGVADCYFSLGFYDFLAPKEAFGKCKEAALKAVALDPNLAEAHASLGVALFYLDWEWPGAEAEFQRAIGLNPNYAAVRYFYGICLTAANRFDDALAEERRAGELDPIQPVIRAVHTFTQIVSGRCDEAIVESRALIEFDPNFFSGWLNLGSACTGAGRFTDAEDAFRKANAIAGGTSTLAFANLGNVLARAGKRNEARKILDQLLDVRKSRYVAASVIATLCWLIDERDRAIEWLELAIEERDHWILYQVNHPNMQGISPDPRIQDVLRRLPFGRLT